MTKKKTKLMGIREYARHRGVSQTAVQDAIKKDKITGAIVGKNSHRKIDPKKADKLWADNTVVNNKNQNTLGDGQTKGPNYSTARAVKESYAAKNEQLKYEEKSGKLCSVSEVEEAARDIARMTRDSLAFIADKLAPVLASETDIKKIHKLLSDEIRSSCENLSRGNWAYFKTSGK